MQMLCMEHECECECPWAQAVSAREAQMGTALARVMAAEEAMEACLTCMQCMALLREPTTCTPCAAADRRFVVKNSFTD